MIPTSERYIKEMAKPLRSQGFVGLEIEVIDPGAAEDITAITTNGEVWYSTTAGIVFDRVPEQTYATFEPGRWLCGADLVVPSEEIPLEQGYVSSQLAGPDGTFSSTPALRFDFGQQRSFAALTLTFDPCCDGYPTRIKAIGYRNGAAVITVAGQPTEPVYELIPDERRGFTNVDRVDVFFEAALQPYGRARLQRVVFGYIIYPGMQEIASLAFSSSADPLCRTLPSKSLSFSLMNFDGAYDPDNPKGIWRDMEERIPIRVYMGNVIGEGMTWNEVAQYTWSQINRKKWRELYEGKGVESFMAGSFYLNALPSTQNQMASFNAISVMELFDREYHKAPPEGGTLYALAEGILEDAEIPKLNDGSKPWQLWDGLKNITTAAPLPLATGRALLQMIANAARCVLYVDRFGIIQLKPLKIEPLDYHMDFNNELGLPAAEKTPALGGVYTNAYAYVTDPEIKELHSGEYTVTAGETVTIKLSRAVRRVEVLAESGVATVYARAVDIYFAAPGTYSVTITGNEVEESLSVVTDPVEDARPTSAWAELDNPLVTSRGWAEEMGAWFKSYLMWRTTYSFGYRGNPEIEALDAMYMQTRFSEKLPALVLEQSINFAGAFSGSMTMKKVGEG